MYIIPDHTQNLQPFASFHHLHDVMLDKEPLLFRDDVIEPTIKPSVSPLSVSKGAGVSGSSGTTHPADRRPGRCDLRAGGSYLPARSLSLLQAG